MSIEETLWQIENKLAELVIGPVLATVAASASPNTDLPQGTVGTLPDNRRVRTLYQRSLTATPSSVPVRLELLTPSFPAKGNFVAIPLGTVVTWVSPPAGVASTAAAEVAFGKNANVLRSGLAVACLGSVGRAERFEDVNDDFFAGAQGSAHAVLCTAPEVRPWTNAGNTESRVQPFELLWKLRFYVDSYVPQRQNGITARHLYDAVTAVLQGSTCGDDPLRFQGWRVVPGKVGTRTIYELSFLTHLWSEGRVMQDFVIAAVPDFDRLDSSIRIPGDADDADPFRVLTDITP